MLAVARGLAADAGAANARFVQGDAQAWPLRRERFDVIISSFGVMFFDDPAGAFANLAAGLRRGGRLAFLCWQDDMLNELFAIPLAAWAAVTRRPVPAGDDLFADPRSITELLSGAGWQDIHIDALSEPAWMGADVADVLGYVRGMAMFRRLVAGLADESQAQQVLAAMAEQYAARQRPDGVWVRAAAWRVTARRTGSG